MLHPPARRGQEPLRRNHRCARRQTHRRTDAHLPRRHPPAAPRHHLPQPVGPRQRGLKHGGLCWVSGTTDDIQANVREPLPLQREGQGRVCLDTNFLWIQAHTRHRHPLPRPLPFKGEGRISTGLRLTGHTPQPRDGLASWWNTRTVIYGTLCLPPYDTGATVHRSPFHSFHADHKAKLVDFAGWELPMLYTSIHEEHHQVRTMGGLFDVSHMGRIKLSGRHARKFIERLATRYVSDMPEKTCRYSMICNANGGVMDDIIVYRFDDHWMLVVNGANRQKIVSHMHAQVGDMSVKIEDLTESTAMVAVQGPKVMEMIGQFSREIPTLKRYAFTTKNLLILKLIISRTGYTGEDGVEVIMGANMAGMAVKLLLKDGVDAEGKAINVKPAGLGARDTLRIEAAMPLYGHELSEELDPLSAGLNFAVTLDKDQRDRGETFIGQDALKKIADEGPTKNLIGLKLDGKRTPRQGMKVYKGDTEIGSVTSGCLSPTLGYPIAMAYVTRDSVSAGDTLCLDLGSTRADAQVVALPFYKRAK
ncbi:MAG: glycine cleavage system aminomethyltransferase GcvT [Phycisphaera sp.]|nr:glycine cleavage system aminomethyltransferase GcvT [Phycisphaera sp.]